VSQLLDMRQLPRVIVMILALLASATGPAHARDGEVSKTTPQGPPRVLDVLSQIESSLTFSRYTPFTRIDANAGIYEFDCSGMAAWVLRRAAPAAWHGVKQRSATGRIVARDFVRQIASVREGKPAWAWERVARVEDARPGDVIAWLKPARWVSNVTGHVGFVMEAPKPSARIDGGHLIRFADASRYHHQDDSRAEEGRDGFGVGTILLIRDPETGAPVAYGWHGDQSAWISETQIVIGRPRR
jgi:hypothetical protein